MSHHYTCEIELMVDFGAQTLEDNQFTNKASTPGYVRGVKNEYNDFLLGQVSGPSSDRRMRLEAIKDLLRGPDCVFVLPAHGGPLPFDRDRGYERSLPSSDFPLLTAIRSRLPGVLALYNGINPHLNFDPNPPPEPSCVRWVYHNGECEIEYNYELTVTHPEGGAPSAPENPELPGGKYCIAVNIRGPFERPF